MVRETVRTVLEHQYRVALTTWAECHPGKAVADLIIAGSDGCSDLPVYLLGDRAPVLWLLPDGAPDPACWSRRRGRLPRACSPQALREAVRGLLAPSGRPPDEPVAEWTSPPFLDSHAAAILLTAIATPLPILLVGDPSIDCRAVALAMHRARGTALWVSAAGASFARDRLEAPRNTSGGTLFLDDIGALGRDGQDRLASLLDAAGQVVLPGGPRLHLITTARADLAPAVESGQFAAPLYHRLSVITAHLVPLRERRADIPELAERLAVRLAVRMGLAPPRLTAAALDRLAHFQWLGDVAELEAVIARTLALRRSATVDADDLVFDLACVAKAPQPHPPEPVERTDGGVPALLIHELTHEFKNPLTTLAAFAQHASRSCPDDSDDRAWARLAEGAVDQMDRFLNNLSEFARLAPPARAVVPLRAVLQAPLAAVERSLTTAGARLDLAAGLPPDTVRVDPVQVAYALTNVLGELARGLTAGGAMHLRFPHPGEIRLESSGGLGAVHEQLAGLADEPPSPDALPIGLYIARHVLALNGGGLDIERRAPALVTVRLPASAGEEEHRGGNGKTARPHRG